MGALTWLRGAFRRADPAPSASTDVVKAPTTPPGARDVSGLAQALAQALAQTGQRAEPLLRDTYPYQFGPGIPLQPAPLDPVRPDSGRAEPRLFEYPVSWNLPGTRNRMVPWRVLRESAERGLMRRCIEIRKRETSTLDWDIVLSDAALETALREAPDTARADVEAGLRDRFAGAREAAKKFWQMPDRGQGLVFSDWLSQLLEEHYVLDAVAIYPRYTYGGDLYSLEILDGSTIKPLLDNRGGRPAPPHAAYQQVLYGFPRGEFVADATGTDGDVIDNGYTADQLIYLRHCVRTWSPYGYSAVEQALEDIDLYLKRRRWMRAEYTHGTSPAGMFKWNSTSAVQWSPEQIKDYERDFNDEFGGQTEERQRWRVLPPGLEPVESEEIARRGWTPDYDLHLIKLVAMHFDVTMPELGFSEAKGLGSSGWHEGQEDVQQRKGTLPTVEWLQDVLTDMGRAHLGLPPELEFRFLGLDSEDEAAADQVAQNRVASGAMTLNERRDEQGLARYDFAEADMPMVITQRGIVFLSGASKLAQPGQMVDPAQEVQIGETPPAEPPTAAGEPQDDDKADGNAPAGKAVAAELAAYRRWSKKTRGGRRFQFDVVTKAAAAVAGVDLDRVVFKADGGGEGPKARSGREWPGWTKDLQAAKVWSDRLSEAMTGAVQTRAIATAWRQARKAPDPVAADARVWLASRGVSLTRPLTEAVRGMWTDGYLIGERSAAAVIDAESTATKAATATVDWAGWEPGDIDAALAVLGEDGAGAGLQRMLDQAGVTIGSIGENRMEDLAEALAEALLEGTSPDELAGILDTILADAQWSYMVAVTEIARAVSQASLDTYRRNGIESMEWATAADQRVCPICEENEAVGPVRVDQLFPSGAAAPPAHPMCRCALLPTIATAAELA